MKPRIDKKIYTIYSYEISEETVKFLGKDSFIVDNFEDYCCNYEFYYDDYGTTWFTSFAKAKKYLKDKIKKMFPNDKYKLIEHKDFHNVRFWEAEFYD